jgi:hypothetical protein
VLITAPTLRLRSIEWFLDRPAQINADLTAKRTIGTPLYGKWSARVDLATYETEALFAPIRSFLVRCNGPVNTFNLPATVEAQNSNTGVTVDVTAAAGATQMALDGASNLLAGDMVTVGDQLLQLVEDQAGGVIIFEPALREEATAGASVETANPYAVVHLAQSEVAWNVEPPARFSASFDVEEAF